MKTFLIWLLVCAIWSSTWLFIKVGLDDLPPISFAAARFLTATTVLLLILAWQKVALPRTKRDWTLAIVTGLMQFAINYGLLFWGEQHISSGLAAVLQATIPAFGLFLAPIYLPNERITIFKIIAIALGIIGVTAIFYEQLNLSGALALWGCAAIVAGAFLAAYASILTKAFGGKMNTASLLAAQMICGVIPLTLVGLATEGNPIGFNWTTNAVLCVIYLALFGSILAFWLFYWLLKRIETTKAMLISLVTPFVAVVIGSAARGETLQPQTLAGGGLILCSVGLILFQPKARIKPLLDESKA